jgi:hypothetical protein
MDFVYSRLMVTNFLTYVKAMADGHILFFWLFKLDLLTFLQLDPRNCDRNGFCISYSSLMVTKFFTYVEAMADGHILFFLAIRTGSNDSGSVAIRAGYAALAMHLLI